MKANKILLTALASAMLVGCANEEIVLNGNENNLQGLNGKLVDAGLLAMDRDGGSEESRAFSPSGKFVWMPTELGRDGEWVADKTQKVGLCWTGRNTLEPAYGATNTLTANVFTNYEYEHAGWLDKSDKAITPKIKDCTEAELVNGAYIDSYFYNGKRMEPSALYGGNFRTGGRWNRYYYGEQLGSYPANNHEESTGDLALNKGVFTTNNASVFEGEYLAYYPYTDAFTKGEIIATLPTQYEIDAADDRYAASSEVSFAIGYINHYEGGNSSAGINGKTLNGFAVVKLYNYEANGRYTTKNISRVILYSKSKGILYSQSLNANACVSALKAGSLGAGTQLAGSKKEFTNTLVAKLADEAQGTEYIEVEGTSTDPTLAGDADDFVWVALPVLPQTINDFEIILVDENEKTCRAHHANGPQTFAPNGANVYPINVDDCTFVNQYMVTDEATFRAAWNKIDLVGEGDLDVEDANEIVVLNDIKFEGNEVPYYAFKKNILVTTECTEDPILTFASEKAYYFASSYPGTNLIYPVLNVNVPVVVEGAGCCEQYPAALMLGLNSGEYVINFNKEVTNHGTLAVNNVEGRAKNLVTFTTLTNTYDDAAVRRDKLTAAAELYLLGEGTEVEIDMLNNKGRVATDAATLTLGTDNVSTLSPITGLTSRVNTTTIDVLKNESTTDAVNSGDIEIEKYTIVNVTSDLKNVDEKALIKINGTSESATDGRLDVKGTSVNNGNMDNTGVVNFTTSSLDNNGLFIDRQSGQVGGKKVDNGSAIGTTTKVYGDMTYKTDLGKAGIYVAQVKTVERMSVVLADAVVEPSTVIVEILGCDATFYNLEEYNKTLNTKDVYVNAPGSNVVLKSYKFDNTLAKNVLTESVFGHCVTVWEDSKLFATDGILNTIKEVNVNENAIFNARAGRTITDAETLVTVGTNLNNEGETYNTAGKLTVLGNMANAGKFDSDKTFIVNGNVTTSGTFDSDGTPNEVGGNFTQTDGAVTFATKTTTTIKGTFTCSGGTFEREGLNGGSAYRATVNVKNLGSVTGGSTTTAWPTEY